MIETETLRAHHGAESITPKARRFHVADLYSSYGRRVFNLAYRMTGNRTVAEDILHEVFVRVIEHADSFRGESSVYSWIFAIAKNECRKTKRRSFRAFQALIESEARPMCQPQSERERLHSVHQVKDGCLTGLLRCLSFHQRVAFVFSVLYRVPTSVISPVLGKSENAVRILVSRARSRLRAFLCKNCSHYDRKNRCTCENMIDFSLKNRLIVEYVPGASPRRIESELKELKSEVLLYRSLSEQDAPPDQLTRLLRRKDLLILSEKKVK